MGAERDVVAEICSQRHTRRADARIARLAARQHGVVCRWQLLGLGLGARAIQHRVTVGRLHSLHRGVYAVGHLVVTREGRWMAAVLAAGPEAVLSHRSAGALWGIRPTSRPRIEVTAPRAVRQRPQLESHRATLRPDEISEEKGIPVTTPARTLLDLAATLSPHELERAVERAEINRLPGLFLGDLVARYRGHRGVRRLAAIAADASLGHTITRSELEERFLAFLDEHGLPRPRVNARVDVAGRVLQVDCVWPGPRVVLELDGYATHGTRLAFERDRERDRLLAAAGWRPTRVTWRQLHRHRDELRRDLSGLLAR